MNTLKLVSLFICWHYKHDFWNVKIGQNNPDIANLEFENHGFLKNHVRLEGKQTVKTAHCAQ